MSDSETITPEALFKQARELFADNPILSSLYAGAERAAREHEQTLAAVAVLERAQKRMEAK